MNAGPNRVLDEIAKLMTDAAGVAQGVRREAETAFRAQAERILAQMDVVQREDYDAMRELAVNARKQAEELAARVEALEERVGKLEAKKPARATASRAAKAKS